MKPLIDTLNIIELKVKTKIGVHAWEQSITQTLKLDIEIPLNLDNCQDELANTIDYDGICQTVTSYLEENSFSLIETVAEKTALLIKKSFKIQKVTVSVSKPGAIKNASNIKVTVQR